MGPCCCWSRQKIRKKKKKRNKIKSSQKKAREEEKDFRLKSTHSTIEIKEERKSASSIKRSNVQFPFFISYIYTTEYKLERIPTFLRRT
jgi:hypothetical protein